MNKKLIRRALALAGAASLCLACAAPVFAADFEEPLREIHLSVSEGNGYYSNRIGTAEGVWKDSLLLKAGESLDFVCESTYSISEVGQARNGLNSKFCYLSSDGGTAPFPHQFAGPIILGVSEDSVIFGKFVPDTEMKQTVRFSNFKLGLESTVKNTQGLEYVYAEIQTDIEVEITAVLQAIAEIPAPDLIMQDGVALFPDEAAATTYRELAKNALDAPASQLQNPTEAVYRYSCSANWCPATSYILHETKDLTCYLPTRTIYEFQGETIVYQAQWEYAGNSNSLLGMQEYVPFDEYGGVELIGIDWLPTGLGGSKSSATRTVATTAGAAALGLGGGAAANALSTGLDSLPAPRRREDFEDPDVPDDTPDLPEEDTPSVSVSFYRPFDDLVNTKGAAVDIQLTVNGGEGLHWNYLPTAICPEGLKAVIPAVAGSSNTATLVLNLTGAAMKKPHIPVFITVVAWAAGADGRLLKTTGTMELQLHRPGLEAERTADGGLKVTLYADGNLDGVAEKVVLKPQQYTCTEEADGALTIEAKPPYKGSCRIAGCKQED